MGTKQQTQTTNAYNPQGMGAYNQMTPQMSGLATQFMQNPFANQQFNMQQLMGNQQANNMNQTSTSGLMQNMLGSGMAGGASNPAAAEMMQNQSRAGTNLQSQLGFMQPVNNALQRQQGAMGLAAGYSPLQTGGTQVKSTSGLGTWLPQIAGMGLGAMTGGMGGGLAGLFGGGGQGGYDPNSYLSSGGFGNSVMGASGSQPGQSFWQQFGSSGNAPYGGGLQMPNTWGGGGQQGGGMMPWFNQGGY